MSYTRDRIGELLVRAGVITEEDLAAALERQREVGGRIGEILIGSFGLDDEVVARALAEQKQVEFLDLNLFPVDRRAAVLLPARSALRARAIPVDFRDGSLVLAMADPLDIETIDDTELRTGMPVIPAVATAAQIEHAVHRYITSTDAVESVSLDTLTAEPEEALEVPEDDAPVVRLVNQILREAIADQASDIHIEPGERGVRVRYRIDGVLHEALRTPVSARAGITSRVKVMAEMDIAERRRPQDGRIALAVDGRPVDMRVATLPTPFGESIVIRILDHHASQQSIGDLGMSEGHRVLFERFLARPYGALFISGPTGSGKSTTLYAGLGQLNVPERKIITIEDPIEYQIDGITQMAARPVIGLSFAHLLRTVLRSDPDVVMVGEIRDAETASIATRAALTGHLVLSSIHTNDAPSALTRLVDMEVAPFVVSNALLGVVAQRLVRRLCPQCRQTIPVDASLLESFHLTREELPADEIYGATPGGCSGCHGTGYHGRLGVFEIMEMNSEIERLFLASAPSEEMRASAIASGMKTLRQDALEKVAAGLTSLEEIVRVVI